MGEVKAVGKKGTIVGGSIYAENGMKANNLGNPAGLSTYVRLGGIRRIRKKEEELNETIESVEQELLALQNAHNEFQKKYAPEIRNTMEIYLKIESAIYTKEKQMEGLLRDKKILKKKLGNQEMLRQSWEDGFIRELWSKLMVYAGRQKM